MGSEGDPTEEGTAGAGRRTEPSDDEEEMQRLRDLEED
jgi:hypothetical protein